MRNSGKKQFMNLKYGCYIFVWLSKFEFLAQNRKQKFVLQRAAFQFRFRSLVGHQSWSEYIFLTTVASLICTLRSDLKGTL